MSIKSSRSAAASSASSSQSATSYSCFDIVGIRSRTSGRVVSSISAEASSTSLLLMSISSSTSMSREPPIGSSTEMS
eukprot:scaffold16488_cov42-Prasinocladus_malaysianus.AAC.2